MDRVEKWLREVEAASRRPVEARVAELLEQVRQGAQRYEGESWDQANERHAEEFITRLREQFAGRVFEVSRPAAHGQQEQIVRQVLNCHPERSEGSDVSIADKETPANSSARQEPPGLGMTPSATPVVLIERQKLPLIARRTTSYNYIFTVPGRRAERLILVAHYDTWRGPGADDNTTGEEICKQYLLEDLRGSAPPELTHSYILAGSEECGLIGFTSQVLLAAGLGVANMAWTKGFYAVTALGLALVPLATFRFGVSGSREYVQSLSKEEVAHIQSVISVDSVGEGKMYIPDSALGADFVRAFIPFEGYANLNSLLREAAHLNGIKYNNFIAGGTTDHVSFLEVNSTLRDRVGDVLGCPRWLGCHKHGKRKIPASALVALCPGKASPVVFGGKLHTPDDVPERVYPAPLAEALRVLDYWFHIMQGGARLAEPREAGEYHFAQLFRVTVNEPYSKEEGQPRGAAPTGQSEYWLVMKDAVEPNRRNINGLYWVDAEVSDGRAVCRNLRVLDWGVHTRMYHEVEDHLARRGSYERVHVRELTIEGANGALRFAARGAGWLGWLRAAGQQALGSFERFLGSNTFLSFFGAAFLLARSVDWLLTRVFIALPEFAMWFFDWLVLTLPVTVLLQLAVALWLIGTKIPTMIDNAYKHLNKADNLRSLKRVASG
jgi:hypothetical protein